MGMVTGSGNTAIHQLFSYDSSGNVVSVDYSSNGGSTFTTYYYLRNAQNDIVKIIDGSGNTVVQYTYDSWGKPISVTGTLASTLGVNQPFRYRGYVYDAETGWYYLQSRYYDPSIGRFISADVYLSTGQGVLGHNAFAYCLNNPVNMSDPTGCLSELTTFFMVVAVAALAVTAVAVTIATCGVAAPAVAAVGVGLSTATATVVTTTATTVATGALCVAGVSTGAAVVSAVTEDAIERAPKGNHSVYVLRDSTGTVHYVGRTVNVERRMLAHKANPARSHLEFEIIASGLTYLEARALEQAGMVYHHTVNTVNKANNQINGVAPKHWGRFKEIALGSLKYGWNQMTNEILYWTGV